MARSLMVRYSVLAVFFFFFMSNTIWGAETIRVGVIGPMKFLQGQGHWNGASLAAEEINVQGGIRVDGRWLPIELIQADSNELLSVADATSAMEKLLGQYHVDFVIGGYRSEAVLAMQDVAMDYKTIFISYGASLGKLCQRVADDYDRYKYFFRGAPLNSKFVSQQTFLQAQYAAEMLRKRLGIQRVKVAIVAENAAWVKGIVNRAQKLFPEMGMEVVGVWQPSPVATNLTPQIKAIKSSGAQLVYTVFSSVVGIPFAKQAYEHKLAALQVGVNVQAQKGGFYAATDGTADAIMTISTYCQGVAVNPLTTHFVDRYTERYGETPPFTAGTYGALMHTLKPALEKAGTLDADTLVGVLENNEFTVPRGRIGFMRDDQGRHLHDPKFGPAYCMNIGVQWQDGHLKGVWPNDFRISPKDKGFTPEGIVAYKVPDWIIAAYQK